MDLVRSDVIIVGCGGAGCRAAIEANKVGADVSLICRGKLGVDGCTPNSASEWMAYSVALGLGDSRDNPEEHFKDIVFTGAYVLDQVLARTIAYEAIERFYDLVRWGVPFLRMREGSYLQLMSDGATYPRACGTGADTGMRIMEALVKVVKDNSINVYENVMAVDLITHHNRVYGVIGINTHNLEPYVFIGKSVILATGGLGDMFLHTVYPSGMSGDGYAMALRAGARLVNMEFMQIGPCITSKVKFDVGGPLWRLNPKLYNKDCEEFLKFYLPRDLSIEEVYKLKSVTFPFTTRNPSGLIDVACFTEITEGRGAEDSYIYFDLTHVGDEIVEKAPYAYRFLLNHGIDLRKEPLKIAPAVQHMNGGVLINEYGETDIKGLYAAGEVAGGQHGADRPGGNSLADCQVFGARAGRYAAEFARNSIINGEWRPLSDKMIDDIIKIIELKGSYEPASVKNQLKRVLWHNATVIRSKESLSKALRFVNTIKDDVFSQLSVDDRNALTALELRNMIDVSIAMLTAMLAREESRGSHYRVDYPFRDDFNWIKFLAVSKRNAEYLVELITPRHIIIPTPVKKPAFSKVINT